MTGPGLFVQTLPPHIHSGDSLARRYWLKSAALLPVLVMAAVFGGLHFLGLLFLSLAGVLGFEWLSSGFPAQKTTLANGETFLTGLLFALLLPERCPPALIVLGAFVAVIVINACFGGLGGRLFHAAVFGRIFLDLIFPGAMSDPVVFRYAGDVWMFGAILASAALFLVQKQIYPESPVYFSAVFLAGAALFGRGGEFLTAAGVGFFSAGFLLTDSVTLPLTRRGTNLFAMGAAFLAVFLCLRGPAVTAVGYAILSMDCVTPWLDVWLGPKTGRARA